jgi:hypothetical protein
MTFDETSFDKMTFDETSFDETSFDETSFDETSFDRSIDCINRALSIKLSQTKNPRNSFGLYLTSCKSLDTWTVLTNDISMKRYVMQWIAEAHS